MKGGKGVKMRDWVKPYILNRTRSVIVELLKDTSDIEEVLKRKKESLSDEEVFSCLSDELNCRFWAGGLDSESEKFTFIFGSVLADLPEDVFKKISAMKNVFYIFTPKPGAEVKIFQLEHDITAGEIIRIVNFPYSDLFDPALALKREIAHEFAHVYLEHVLGVEGTEDEADRIAIDWGFEEQIKELPKLDQEGGD
jgi:hypothetical protein